MDFQPSPNSPPQPNNPPDINQIFTQLSEITQRIEQLDRKTNNIPSLIESKLGESVNRNFMFLKQQLELLPEIEEALKSLSNSDSGDNLSKILNEINKGIQQQSEQSLKLIEDLGKIGDNHHHRREQELRLWFKNLFNSFSQQKVFGLSLNWVQAIWYQAVFSVCLALAMTVFSLGVYWEVRQIRERGVVCLPRR